MAKITSKVYDNLSVISQAEWDNVFGDTPEGYWFYKTLEESRLKDFSFYYLVLSDAQKILLIAPLFVADFNLDIAVEGFLAGVVKFWRKAWKRFLTCRTLFCGSPFSEWGVLGGRDNLNNNPALLAAFLSALDDFSQKSGAPLIMFKDFRAEDTIILDRLQTRYNFLKVNSFPSVFAELKFSSLDGYFNSLGPSTRKDLRRKIKQANAQGKIEVKAVDQPDDIIDDIFRLYEQAYHDGSVKFERLTKEFFINISRNLPKKVKFFLYYVNGSLGAFNLCFVYRDSLIDKFIGFNYDISRRYNLYFVSWVYNIQWCLDNSLRYYHVGQTDYEPKLRLGTKVIPLYAYLKHRNYFINSLLALAAILLKPDNFDKELR